MESQYALEAPCHQARCFLVPFILIRMFFLIQHPSALTVPLTVHMLDGFHPPSLLPISTTKCSVHLRDRVDALTSSKKAGLSTNVHTFLHRRFDYYLNRFDTRDTLVDNCNP